MLKKQQLIGMAAKANRVEDLPYRVEQLLGSKKLGEMGGWRNPWAGPTRRNLSAGKCCRVRQFQIRCGDENDNKFCGGFILILLKPKSLQQAKFGTSLFPIQSSFHFTPSIGFDHLRRFHLSRTGQ